MRNNSAIQAHYRACNLCEAICGLVITLENGNIIKIKGDPDDPLSRGHICPKALALQDVYRDKNRLKQPLKKTASGWQNISWKKAFEITAQKIREIQLKHGRDAIGFYQGNPSVHNLGTMLFSGQLRKALSTKNNFSATSLDQLPHQFVAQLLYGHPLMLPVPDVDRTQYFLIIGANPLTSNGSMMTAPGMMQRIKNIRKNGEQVIVIDPRKTETAKKADKHFFINPETDVYLLLALVHQVIFTHGIRLRQAEAYVRGIDKLAELVQPYPPQTVAGVTGIQASGIEKIAHDFYMAKAAVCYGRMGVSVQRYGTLCQWLINILNIITGNLDRPGGLMFTLPAITIRRGIRRNISPRWHSRVSHKREFMGELPTAVLQEEINTPGQGQIRGLVVSAGNPVISAPNSHGMIAALKRLDFMVCIDIYLNETSQLADLILPPATGLETDHYDLVFNSLAVRNVARFSRALFKPVPDARYDWQIFKTLANKISRSPWWKSLLTSWKTPRRLVDGGLRTGPYGRSQRLSLKKLLKSPHGIDLGPLSSQFPHELFTKDKEIELGVPIFSEAIKSLSAIRKPKKEDTLLLISRRHLRSNNSWMRHIRRLQGGSNICSLQINPVDARGLETGCQVKVRSVIGDIIVPIEVTDDMMPGVVSLPQGKIPGINELTDETRLDKLTGNAAFSGIEVTINPLDNSK